MMNLITERIVARDLDLQVAFAIAVSRDEAIELVGLENVQQADCKAATVEEDVDWGLIA